MRYVTREATEHLNTELKLGARGDEQDWEIELADPDRLEEFIAFYHHAERDDDIDFALVSLIVTSFDVLVFRRLKPLDTVGEDYGVRFKQAGFEIARFHTPEEIALWYKIAEIILSDPGLYGDIVRYWSGKEDTGIETAESDYFSISMFFLNLPLELE